MWPLVQGVSDQRFLNILEMSDILYIWHYLVQLQTCCTIGLFKKISLKGYGNPYQQLTNY
jgi:hypothetical protein